jgi:heptosyltransferase-1
MMDVLIVKTSSLGDVIHALPVLSDIQRVHPDWKVAWMVEETFQDLPRLHPFCLEVVLIATRRWRKSWLGETTQRELKQVRKRLKEIQPRYVLDLQGLIKSAVLARLSPGLHLGYRWGSARENLATLLYEQAFPVSWNQHAVERNRVLAAQAFAYDINGIPCDYGLNKVSSSCDPKQALLIHSSSWQTKLWPEENWIALGHALNQQGFKCLLPSGSTVEWDRAKRIALKIPQAQALAPGPLSGMIATMQGVSIVVGVDTGLTHLATAFGLPTVALYTVTDPSATGVYGSKLAKNLGGKGVCPSVNEVMVALQTLLITENVASA